MDFVRHASIVASASCGLCLCDSGHVYRGDCPRSSSPSHRVASLGRPSASDSRTSLQCGRCQGHDGASQLASCRALLAHMRSLHALHLAPLSLIETQRGCRWAAMQSLVLAFVFLAGVFGLGSRAQPQPALSQRSHATGPENRTLGERWGGQRGIGAPERSQQHCPPSRTRHTRWCRRPWGRTRSPMRCGGSIGVRALGPTGGSCAT